MPALPEENLAIECLVDLFFTPLSFANLKLNTKKFLCEIQISFAYYAESNYPLGKTPRPRAEKFRALLRAGRIFQLKKLFRRQWRTENSSCDYVDL